MKTGRSLVDLAAELQRQHDTKRDYLANTTKLSMSVYNTQAGDHDDNHNVILHGINGGMTLKPIAHAQMASTLQIPKPYYDRMLAEAPDLLANNVNRWLEKQPAKKLVRTLDGQVRAILSDSYRPLDSMDLAMAILPTLQKLEAKVESCEVTDARMYIKATTPKIAGVVAKMIPGTHNRMDDLIQAGIAVSNSEVGMGALSIAEMTYRLVCSNGAIHEQAIRKAHLGRGSRSDLIEEGRQYFSTQTQIADDRAFFMKVQDTAKALLTQERLEMRLNGYQEAAGVPVVKPAEEVVELTARHFGFNEAERTGILKAFLQAGDETKWGLANAITRAAQDVESYDRSTEMEQLGASVVELPQATWKVIAGTSNAV